MIMCTICHEEFNGDDVILSTRCGHIYHNNCLMMWLEGSTSTCPQCRAVVDKKKVIKLHLDNDPNIHQQLNKQTEEQINSLKNQLESFQKRESIKHANNLLKARLKSLKCSCKEMKEARSTLKLNINGYRTKLDELINKYAARDVDLHALVQDKLNIEKSFSIKENETHSLERELYELQSNNCVTIETLKLELDSLKAKKKYYENKCNISKYLKDFSSSTSEQINTENDEYSLLSRMEFKTQLVVQRSKLTSDFSLRGLVFFIFEDENWYIDKSNDTSMSKHNIIKYGGTVVDVYSENVTHVICPSQRNQLVQQALKDKKICVTNYWLIDVISKKYITPPWLAHHLPAPYSKEIGFPCEDIQIAITNFDVNEYYIVKTLVQFTGADFVEEMSRKTNIVIAKNLTGMAVELAQLIDVPIVNIQWLNDIISGVLNGLYPPLRERYFRFNTQNPFQLNYGVLKTVMEAWKNPGAMNCIYEYMDEYFPIVNPTEFEKPRMLKTEDLINLVDDDDLDDDL